VQGGTCPEYTVYGAALTNICVSGDS
jgi:hypothetical protein